MAARALADKVVLLLQLLLSFPGWSQLVYVTQVHHLTNLHTQTTWSCTSSAHTHHLDTQTTINHPPTQNTHLYKPPTHINCQKQKPPTVPPKPTYPAKPLTCKNHPPIQTTYPAKIPMYTNPLPTKTTCLYNHQNHLPIQTTSLPMYTTTQKQPIHKNY